MDTTNIFPTDFFGIQGLTTIGESHEPWFMAKQVALLLGYKNSKKAIADHVAERDKMRAEDLKNIIKLDKTYHPHTVCINESGLYSLILGSEIKSAEPFKLWVTTKVLPILRTNRELSELVTNTSNELNKKIDDYKKLAITHNRLKLRRNYHTLKKGACFYITHNYLEQGRFKLGNTKNISETLRCYRRNAPYTLLDCVVYTSDSVWLETAMLKRYRCDNHEVVGDISIETLLKSLEYILNVVKIEHTYLEQSEIDAYNYSVKINIIDIIPPDQSDPEDQQEDQQDDQQEDQQDDRQDQQDDRQDQQDDQHQQQQQDNHQEEDQQEDERLCKNCGEYLPLTPDYFPIVNDKFIHICHTCRPPLTVPKTKYSHQKSRKCIDCQTPIDRGAERCTVCYRISTRCTDRPSYEKLCEQISKHGYVQVGKMYGVSDNGIRKWVKSYLGLSMKEKLPKVLPISI